MGIGDFHRDAWNVALHPEGVDRNTDFVVHHHNRCVALHPEGVDRNVKKRRKAGAAAVVALHPEGVDRNGVMLKENTEENEESPSTRRAWIEILPAGANGAPRMVALHPEGVDRNHNFCKTY